MAHLTDWIMIAITIVYVIATIFICHANYKSAKASNDQLDEMKRQYEEKDRPFIDTELVYIRRVIYAIRFTNHGYYSARHVNINLSDEFLNSLQDNAIRTFLIKQKGKECIIGSGQHYDLYIADNSLKNNKNIKPVDGTITYESNGKKYESDIYIDLENYMTFFSTDTEMEIIAKAIEDNSKEINKVSGAIKNLNKTIENDKQ